ncbi:MAG TPA: hypothetical protein VN325_31075 [Steroidobacteraceae bacterium]|nr:hypothetical protein [Steroidobacteraceae bacterium]
MFYPQGNFHSQANLGYPQVGVGFPQGGTGYPQGGFGYSQGSLGQQSSQATPNAIPFANTLYGYPQLTPYFPQGFAQSPPHVSNWQHLAQQQAALQQALLQLLAPQLAAQSPAFQHPAGISGFNGMANGGFANGVGQSVGAWQQPLPTPEQINPAVLQQPQHQLQRLAQYHSWVAQQFAQLAAQQAVHNSASPYAGQFIPGTGQFIPSQLGANFVPGITMH